jgi:adenylate cyclase
MGLLGAFVLGFTSIRRVTFPVRRLREAAQSVAKGELGTQVSVRGRDELAELGEAFNQMTRGLRERERLKATFSRYVSGEIASRILSESSDLDVKGELVEATILFLDIRGFTSLSEQLSPREVVELLNAYFERVISSVMRHEGVVNKFIGDAVMALFGAPRRVSHSEELAVRAALEIQEQVAQLSQERRRAGLRTAEFGAGVNTGPTIAGNLGSQERLEYTVIGDAVNLAQRLEGQAGPGEVVISAATLERLGTGFVVEPRGEVRVKGKQQPVQLFRVTGRQRQTG